VLRQMYPAADLPVVQLSIDGRQPAAYHLELGARLLPLRDEGVLVVGSGNVVHNLRAASFGADDPYPWAEEFDLAVAAALDRDDRDVLVDWTELPGGGMSHPSPDHWYPLHYALGARDAGEPVQTVCTGYAARSISMRSVRFG
jgi:4,5-DOPA dioxygenase extradiol